MPESFLVRVTTEDHVFVKEKLLKGKKTICCSELGDETEKPHVHFIIFESKTTTYNRLKKAGYAGNEDFAFSTVGDGQHDVQNIINYICKGESVDVPPVILVNTMGFTSEQIRQYQVDYWTHEKSKTCSGDKGARAKVPSKDRKPTFMDLVQAKWEETKLNELRVLWDKSDKTIWDADNICYHTSQWLMQEFKTTFKKLQDLPVITKYTSYLVLDIFDTVILARLWSRKSPGTFFLG